MFEGATVDPWAIAVFDGRCYDGDQIGRQLADCCMKRGMRMRQPSCVEKEPNVAQRYAPADRVEKMFAALAAHKPVFILVILPDKDSELYGNLSSQFGSQGHYSCTLYPHYKTPLRLIHLFLVNIFSKRLRLGGSSIQKIL
jgi:hypothetical protein